MLLVSFAHARMETCHKRLEYEVVAPPSARGLLSSGSTCASFVGRLWSISPRPYIIWEHKSSKRMTYVLTLFQIPDRNSESPCGSKGVTSDKDFKALHRFLDEEIEHSCPDCLVELDLFTTNLFSRVIGQNSCPLVAHPDHLFIPTVKSETERYRECGTTCALPLEVSPHARLGGGRQARSGHINITIGRWEIVEREKMTQQEIEPQSLRI